MVKAFRLPRPLSEEEKARFLRLYPEDEALIVHTQGGLPAHSLVSACGALSAIGNDLGGEYVFSQQVAAYARSGDVLLCFSTSGNSRPVVNAAKMARFWAHAVRLLGKGGGKLAEVCDVLAGGARRKRTACNSCICLCIMFSARP
ncbi:MAG: SIS domain-containing protein [Christensenellaceae bacterium]